MYKSETKKVAHNLVRSCTCCTYIHEAMDVAIAYLWWVGACTEVMVGALGQPGRGWRDTRPGRGTTYRPMWVGYGRGMAVPSWSTQVAAKVRHQRDTSAWSGREAGTGGVRL